MCGGLFWGCGLVITGGGEGRMEIYGVEPGGRVVKRVRMESANFSIGLSFGRHRESRGS